MMVLMMMVLMMMVLMMMVLMMMMMRMMTMMTMTTMMMMMTTMMMMTMMMTMKTSRSTLTTMMLVILGCLLGLFLQADAQGSTVCLTDPTYRTPANTDISVTCGSQFMDLSIYICPIYNALYNESLMVLNNQLNNPACYGVADFVSTPPVLTFRFPINDTLSSNCANKYVVNSQTGTGAFSDFSNVQSVNISGVVTAIDPSAGTITYRSQILYYFSCSYPMNYLLNDTQLSVSGVNVAIRDNNGNFISTLNMNLYCDNDYQRQLVIPRIGLNQKTKIYVEVKATNLTSNFNVLLDRCFATVSPSPVHNSHYDLFVGCMREPQIIIDENGDSQSARFNFEAFRFRGQRNQIISTFYLHCQTRLCDPATCSSLKPVCNRRRKRETLNNSSSTSSTTISSYQILVRDDNGVFQNSSSLHVSTHLTYSRPVVAIIVCISIVIFFIVALAAYFYYRRQRSN
ncbi:zona pellucida-like domain-containing protein 1 [Austrofundulus limnaeus]|uniref:Zona pellucida-like domain-containing protein 1 n=1 Tax=Austrofundulus limnaeus TaxID=52670 RepID=A0A2I4D6H2_AUSLI|nr:PREDICTED: zona pellucida-like domain-containing protein 1 [Austrofundulus limnaeus]